MDIQNLETQYHRSYLFLKKCVALLQHNDLFICKSIVLVFRKNHYLKKSNVLNNSQISKLHGVDYEFIPVDFVLISITQMNSKNLEWGGTMYHPFIL